MKPLFLLFLLGLGLVRLAVAGLPPAPSEPTPTAAALIHFMPEPTPIDLRGAHARAEVAIPIAAGLEPQRLTLYLAAANSVALMSKRSVLRVLLDDALVAQIPLDPKLPRIEASIELPVQGLKPGYHRLVFDAAQHYTEACEDPAAPELWTQIDTRRSWLKLEARPRGEPLSLAELDRLFDARRWGPQQLTIATVGAVTPDVVRLGALASQVAALRLRYRPLRVVHRPLAPRPDALDALLQATDDHGPVVLLGAPQATAAVLGRTPRGGARVALHRLTGWPERPMLVVEGTPQEMERALQALAVQRVPLPDRAETGVGAVSAAPIPTTLPVDRPVRLQALGWTGDLEVRGRYGSRAIEFTLPADFYTPREDFLSLRLNLVYGAGLRKDSALNVVVNGHFAHAVPLDGRDGTRYDGYEVRIPLAMLQPGHNRVLLSAHLIPSEGGQCIEQAIESMRLTVRNDSTLQLPPHAQVAAVPDLRLLGRGAYPYAEARSLGLWLGGSDSETLAAAWTLLARLAQTRTALLPPLRVSVGPTPPEGTEDLILVGTPRQFPPGTLVPAPLRADGRILHGELDPLAETPASVWRRWFSWLVQGVPAAAARPAPVSVTVEAPSLGRQGALLQWLDERGRLLTWLAADDPALLQSRVQTLIEPAVCGRLEGDVMLWQDADTVHTDRVGDTRMRGSAGWAMRLSYLLSQRPVYWVGAGLLILLLAWSTRALLLRFKARRHPGVREEEA